MVSIDASRVNDPEIAADGEGERLRALATQFSAEDLMRAFEVLTKAEVDIRASMQPRYHLEMALLRWIHLRKLVPLVEPDSWPRRPGACGVTHRADRPRAAAAEPPALGTDHASSGAGGGGECSDGPSCRGTPGAGEGDPVVTRAARQAADGAAPNEPTQGTPAVSDPAALKAAFLAEVQKAKKFFYGTVIAQAHHIDVEPDRIVIAFAPQHKALRVQVDPRPARRSRT